jgi:hypothetical protein
MPSTIVENDKLEVPVGTTAKGHDLVIVNTPMGFYRIESRGPGPQPQIANELFTSLTIAKRELDAWKRTNAALYAKEELKRKIVASPTHKEQRLAAAKELKNGEVAVQPEED